MVFKCKKAIKLCLDRSEHPKRPEHKCPAVQGCRLQAGNGIELETVGRQFEPYRWRDFGPEQSW